jgi:predicted RNA-binding Zn-ribbon protein involved in translation (DUF1610 family)
MLRKVEREGGVGPARLRCRACGAETVASVNGRAGPCPDCGGPREIVERLPDRRQGKERRSEGRLQRRWDYDPRSWFDRRQD